MNSFLKNDCKDGIRVIVMSPEEMKELFTEALREELKKNPNMLHSSSAPDRKFWTRNETAARLSITLPTLHEWSRSGKLKSYKIGRRILYKPEEVEKALTQQASRIRG